MNERFNIQFKVDVILFILFLNIQIDTLMLGWPWLTDDVFLISNVMMYVVSSLVTIY